MTVLFSFFFLSSPAQADCTGPAGVEGEVTYDTAHKTMVFCNDTSWVSMKGGLMNVLPTDCAIGEVAEFDGTDWVCGEGSGSGPACSSPLNADNNPQFFTGYSAPVSYTVGAGDGRLLVVGVLLEDDVTGLDVASVTFDGNPLTPVAEARIGTGWEDVAELWVLPVDKVMGAGNHTGNIAMTTASGNTELAKMLAVEYLTGVDQDNPVLQFTSGTSATTSVSTNYTAAGSSLSVTIGAHNVNGTINAQNGQTKLGEIQSTGETATLGMGYKIHTVGGAETLGWSTGAAGVARFVQVSAEVKMCAGGSLGGGGTPTEVTYTYTGADQTFNVPAGVTSLSFKVWGAGGGQKNSGYGGAGGFVSGSVPVTAGQTVTLIVGQGGSNISTGTYNYGGGGWISTDDAAGGSGGGRSAVRINGVEVLTAGGGGGGGYGSGNVGGVGGGSAGGNAIGSGAGSGATSSAGGAGGTSTGGTAEAGIQYRGGRSTTSYAGGGGGGGWYGGGGGSGTGYNHGGGGGGSGYVAGSVTGGVNTAGSGTTPPNQGDPDYVAGVGVGATSGATGGNGLIVMSY